jgi:hypothetical protein
VVVSSGVKRQAREADHSPPSSDQVKNSGANHILLHLYDLINEAQGQFYHYLIYEFSSMQFLVKNLTCSTT